MTRSLISRVRRVVRCQSGFTLLELVASSALLGLVITSILAFADVGQKLTPKDQERAHVIREAQTGLHSMTRELRQARQIRSARGDSITVRVLSGGTLVDVTYSCTTPHPTAPGYTRCYRSGDGPSRMVIDRVLNGSSVFEYTRSSRSGVITWVRAKVEVPAKGDLKEGYKHKVVLDDGFYMRNLNLR